MVCMYVCVMVCMYVLKTCSKMDDHNSYDIGDISMSHVYTGIHDHICDLCPQLYLRQSIGTEADKQDAPCFTDCNFYYFGVKKREKGDRIFNYFECLENIYSIQ